MNKTWISVIDSGRDLARDDVVEAQRYIYPWTLGGTILIDSTEV
jgi:hypothetical protein